MVMPVVFGEIKMSFLVRIKASWHFRTGNSTSQIWVIIFLSLEFSERSASGSEQVHSS